MTEAQDLQSIVRAIDDALNLLNGHLELSTADAPATISSVHTVLSSPDLSQSLERVRLRALNRELTHTSEQLPGLRADDQTAPSMPI